MKRVILCGGGTGGHIFPSIAVAEILKKESCDLLYLGVNGKPEEQIAEQNGIGFYGYDFSGFPRKLEKELISWPFNLLNSVSKAKLYLKHFMPHIIFGTGGYSAAPVFIAAKRLNIPYIIHNLDVRLGLANKFCANGASILTLGFKTKQAEEMYSKNMDIIVTGNPVRECFLHIDSLNKDAIYKEFKLSPHKKTIFLIGGSQGATAINETILEILKDLVLTNDIQVIHQVGNSAYDSFIRRLPAKVTETQNYIAKPFFENPEKCYLLSDLVISRAGAMTTTEITVTGKPAIFIPYPFAGNHQEANILHLKEAGGAILFRQKDLKSKELLNSILELINNEERLNSMSKILKSFAKPNSAEIIANLILAKSKDSPYNSTDFENLSSAM